MIDSHCHLDHEPLISNISEILKRSKNVGIKKILTICTTLNSYEKIKKILKLDDIIYGTFGIHPHETKNNIVSQKIILDNIKVSPKIIGIGETGLDFYYNNSEKNMQIESFKIHIEASIHLNMPIIVHSRSAENETFRILKSYEKFKPKILMHCFTGTAEFAHKLLTLGSYFSASGIITFKNSTDLQETFKLIPNDKLLIETDSPYLAPVPLRGKPNEPSFIIHTVRFLSELKKLSFDEFSKITTQNFFKLFGELN